jgi:hypothetical protein
LSKNLYKQAFRQNHALSIGALGMKRLLFTMFLITLVCALTLINGTNFSAAQTVTQVTGILGSDTIWSRANNPYSLTGNVLINNGVTLRIDPGVVVNLNSFLLMVNGTINARGTTTEKIQFSGGQITFTQSSTSWNEQTGTGSIIEYANLETTGVSISGSSPKISSNLLQGIVVSGSTVFSNNTAKNLVTVSGSPTVWGNTLNGGLSLSSDVQAPAISYNTISGAFNVYTSANSPKISHNIITGGTISIAGNSPLIEYNTVTVTGMDVSAKNATVSFNTINGVMGISSETISIFNNTLTSSNIAISFIPEGPASSVRATITNNTINARNIGVNVPDSFSAFLYGWWGDAIISGNTISNCATAGILVGGGQGQSGYVRYDNVTILNNLFFGNNYAINTSGTSKIEGNTILNNYGGILGGAPIRNNIVSNNTYGISGGEIEGNLVINNKFGITGSPIKNNTIVNNAVGILGGFSSLVYNNIYGNTMNVNFTSPTDGNATNNWWGTTDASAINQTIRDYKNDFLIGRVNFVPFLTAPNLAAPAAQTPIPNPSPSPSPTANPTPTPNHTATPTPTPTPNPTSSLTPTSTPTPFSNPTSTPTLSPTLNPTTTTSSSAPSTSNPTLTQSPTLSTTLAPSLSALPTVRSLPSESSSPSANASPTPSPTVPEFPLSVIIALLVIVGATAILILRKRA